MADMPFNKRDKIIDDVAYGRMTPQEADAEARRLGLEPFERVPGDDEFDPLKEPNWSLPMAIAWIAHRSIEAVRRASENYAKGCWYWARRRWRVGPDGDIHEGWHLEQGRIPTSLGLELLDVVVRLEEGGQTGMMTVPAARQAIWEALREGMLPATGEPRLSTGRVPIPADEWSRLLPTYSEYRDEVGVGGSRVDYASPMVPSRAVRHLWGPRRNEGVEVPALAAPEGDGYMPLFCAAHWIAAEGGAVDVQPNDDERWRVAYEQLLAALASGRVRVVGLRDGSPELIPPHQFAGIRVDYPYDSAPLDLMLSEITYLRSYPYVDDEHWRGGFDDALISRRGDQWKQIMVEKSDVSARWPFPREEDMQPKGTGYAGRPTKARHLISREFERRVERGELASTLREQAADLLAWLAEEHSDVEAPKSTTVENNLRDAYREASAATK